MARANAGARLGLPETGEAQLIKGAHVGVHLMRLVGHPEPPRTRRRLGAREPELRVTQHGGPGVLAVQTVDVPEPGPGQVRVRVEAAGINFIDVYQRQGLSRADPFTPAWKARDRRVGRRRHRYLDRVSGGVGDGAGAAAGLAVLPAASAVPVPGRHLPLSRRQLRCCRA